MRIEVDYEQIGSALGRQNARFRERTGHMSRAIRRKLPQRRADGDRKRIVLFDEKNAAMRCDPGSG